MSECSHRMVWAFLVCRCRCLAIPWKLNK